MNPLLTTFNTPFNTVPFDRIENEHFLPAIELAIGEAKARIRKIRKNKSKPDFKNTIEALEYTGENIERIARIFFNLNHAETNDAIQDLAKTIAPKLTGFQNDITLDQKLFARIQVVFNESEKDTLTREQKKLLENTYKNFIRNGANLTDKEKDEFRSITSELSVLTVQFGENVLAETNNFILHLTSQDDLSGLPPDIAKAASEEAKKRNLPGWVFTLQIPSFMPFMKYADNRELRKKMFVAYNSRGHNGNNNDNRQIIKRITELRLKQAKILGYDTYASFVLEDRMAENINQVTTFLDELRIAYYSSAQEEVNEVAEFAKTLKANFDLQRWDWSYYAEKLKEQKYSINDETFRPYFELEKVQKGIFHLAERLYGITFHINDKIPLYNKDVKAYEVHDELDNFLAVLYLDFFPRESKKGGAWMTEFEQQHINNRTDIRPHVSLVFNFTPPSSEKPSLLTYQEVRTFLHEFGHALHGIFSKVSYTSLAGTEVYRDFVELPSQIMENWADKKEWLDTFALHHLTGEKIPEILIHNLIESRNYNEAYFGCRQLCFGYLDMAWHTLTSPCEDEVEDMEKKTLAHIELLPAVNGTLVSTSFSHIFGGGYAAGYYSYKWSEVLDTDAFALFEENGIFDKYTAQRFRESILSKGGTEHPMKLYVDFRGREPSIDALLKRSGLKK